jgi:hypothetical protein
MAEVIAGKHLLFSEVIVISSLNGIVAIHCCTLQDTSFYRFLVTTFVNFGTVSKKNEV